MKKVDAKIWTKYQNKVDEMQFELEEMGVEFTHSDRKKFDDLWKVFKRHEIKSEKESKKEQNG